MHVVQSEGSRVKTAVVITTIQGPTAGVQAISARATDDLRVIVIGDKKSPSEWACEGADYFSYEAQLGLPFESASVLPANSYTRKMLGYLIAAEAGCAWIRETDDDNTPYDEFFDPPRTEVLAREPVTVDTWTNIYAFFTDRFIWPRGFPLRHVQSSILGDGQPSTRPRSVAGKLVFQGLADGDPDVDAIYRLTAPDHSPVTFERLEPLVLPRDSWTPFNSQATTWPRSLLPLMYLPATCSFRMTDIWRSFVAGRLMQGLDANLVVTAPVVHQERNDHDLMHDFRDEVEGYVGYEGLVETLNATELLGGSDNVLADLRTIYEALCSGGYLRLDELGLLDAWIADVRSLDDGLGDA